MSKIIRLSDENEKLINEIKNEYNYYMGTDADFTDNQIIKIVLTKNRNQIKEYIDYKQKR